MSLSKAISTSLKKSSLLLILFSLVLLLPLSGASFRIAIVSQNNSYKALVDDVLDIFLPLEASDYASNKILERLDLEESRAYYSSLDKAYKNEDFITLQKLYKQAPSVKDIKYEIVNNTFSDAELDYLYRGDKEAFEYLKMRDGLDMLIAISEVSNDILPEIELYIDGESVQTALYADALRSDEVDNLIALFSEYLLPSGYRILDIIFPRTGTLYVDGEPYLTYINKIALKDGKHQISYIVPGYRTKSVEIVVKEDTKHVNLDLELLDKTLLYLSTKPYNADVFYNGKKLDSRFISDVDYPFTLTAKSDGFSLYSLQSLMPIDSLNITLKPEWMARINLIEESKGEFYMNLFTTLLSFGTFVASQTVTNLVPEYNLQPVSVVLGGVSLVSLINMVDSMFEYFNSAKYEM